MIRRALLHFFSLLSLAAVTGTPAMAQTSDEHWQLLNRLLEVSNSINADTAREAHKQCVEIGKEIEARTDMPPAQKLYFQSEVESCIFYAMNNGEFADESGDACAHHFRFAQLLTDAILGAQGMEGVVQEQFTEMRYRLERASDIGPQVGCSNDYAGLLASLPASDTVVEMQRGGVPDEELMGLVSATTGSITTARPKESHFSCLALADEIAGRGLQDVERLYFEAMIEDCIARSMVAGAKPDDVGDTCTHHHLYASKLTEALMFDEAVGFFDAGFREFVGEQQKEALRQGPEMGCTQDYAGLALQ